MVHDLRTRQLRRTSLEMWPSESQGRSTTAHDHRTRPPRPPHTNHRAPTEPSTASPDHPPQPTEPHPTTSCTRSGSEGRRAHPGSLLGRCRHRADTCAQRVEPLSVSRDTHSGNPQWQPQQPGRAAVPPACASPGSRLRTGHHPWQFPCLNFASACPRGGPQKCSKARNHGIETSSLLLLTQRKLFSRLQLDSHERCAACQPYFHAMNTHTITPLHHLTGMTTSAQLIGGGQ